MRKFWKDFVYHPIEHLGLMRAIAWVAAATLIVSLGLIRYETDAEYAFSSFVLIPIWLVAWFCGRGAGLALSVMAAVTWGMADMISVRPFSAEWIPVVNAITRGVTYVLLVLITSWLKEALELAEQIASCDGLTGLLNRSAFYNAGEKEVVRSRRYRRNMAVVFLDLDDFKKLNDTQGHRAGDDALKATSRALIRVLRASDVTARLGGDEFAVILPEIGYEAAIETGHRILAAIRQAMKPYPPVTASVGVTWYASPKARFEEMLGDADDLMYQIKKQEKCGVRVRRFDGANPGVGEQQDIKTGEAPSNP